MEQEEKKNKSESALREERILEFWKANKIFEKSLRKDAPKGKYVFYDGPPFATGVPHYGHILGSTVKDVFGRYETMLGYNVPRRWGWDCHGLPIENIVENDLHISGKKEIEAYGIDKFSEYARSKVLTYVAEWRKTIDRMGRWVDFDNSYKTMDNTFIESVWWALGELNKKGLLYEGVRVLAYCPRCETPIANSEIAMDNSYKDITDISVYVKFKIESEENIYLLAWTTTPWTLPGNTAVALHKDFDYIYVSHSPESGKETLIIAKELFEKLKSKFVNPEIVKETKGSELVGLSYEPLFSYFINADLPNKENIWKVWHADFVTLEDGTGIVHEAPAFGEDDMNLARTNSIPFIRHVEPNGTFSAEVKDFAGIKVKPKEDPQAADILIIKHLAHENKLFAKEKIVHSYPHCYRCETPLLYYALPSWFVNIQKVKENMLGNARAINWIPTHLKEGRFKNTMESAPDWTISRNRYWASPLPFWKSKSGKTIFVNSLADLKNKTKKSGNHYFVMRHGGTEGNKTDRVSSRVDGMDPLTKEGEEEVQKTAEKLKTEKIDLIISSDLLRTKQTTKILQEVLGLSEKQVVFEPKIREIMAYAFEGKTWAEYPYMFKQGPEGNESTQDVRKRVLAFLYEADKKYQNKNILIVTHDDLARLMFSFEKGVQSKNGEEFWQEYPGFQNAECRKLDFTPLPHNSNYELDLHRPYIDAITLVDEIGEEYNRIPEVIDCWFESGSMPFAQDHFPFENTNWQKENFPAGFVAEYIAQTRTWFYYTHVISSIIFNQAPFENVVTTGTVLAEDGQKMSKSKGNFPDPWILFNKYGVDALRFYLMSCPVMKGEDINFSEKSVQEVSNKIISRLYNVLAFYELYRDPQLEVASDIKKSDNILDQWILARLDQAMGKISLGMNAYDLSLATEPIELFIDDLSNWYLRRSRDRLRASINLQKIDDSALAKCTLYFVLKNLAKIMAPFAPFTAEDVWQKLKNEKDEESIHLSAWPKVPKTVFGKLFGSKKDSKILEDMEQVRKIVTLGLEARQKAGLKVRQPLARLEVKNLALGKEYLELIRDEINVKEILENKNLETEVLLDVEITPELKDEGNYRELVRSIQDLRKKMGLTPCDVVSILIETDKFGQELVRKFENDLKKTVSAGKIEFKDNDGESIKIGDLSFKTKIEK